LKDSTILILGAGGLGLLAVGGYLFYKAFEKAAAGVQKTAQSGVDSLNNTLAIPGNTVKKTTEAAGNTASLIGGMGSALTQNEGIIEHGATEGGRELTGGTFNSYSAGVFGDRIGNVSVEAQKNSDARADSNFQMFCMNGQAVFDNAEGLGYPRWHCVENAAKPAMTIGR
jgi:hypothetical protein